MKNNCIFQNIKKISKNNAIAFAFLQVFFMSDLIKRKYTQ